MAENGLVFVVQGDLLQVLTELCSSRSTATAAWSANADLSRDVRLRREPIDGQLSERSRGNVSGTSATRALQSLARVQAGEAMADPS